MSMQRENASSRKPDALRELYLDAVSEDRGPSPQSTEAILAHARQRAAEANQPAVMPVRVTVGQQDSKPAANERFWLRHALGGLAAIGLVGWLMLQHAAWWDGSDKGLGMGPQHDLAPAATSELAAALAEVAAPADIAPAQAASAASQAAVAADSAVMIKKSIKNRASEHMGSASKAMKEEANPSQPSRAEHSVKTAPAAKMQPQAAPSRAEVRDSASEKEPDLSQLPLCPEGAGQADAKTAAKAKPESKDDKASLACRPRKPDVKSPASREPGTGAAGIEAPEN